MDALAVIGLIVGPGGILALVIAFFRDRRTVLSTEAANKDAAIASRFDDASDLAKYIREEVDKQVEPLRRELAEVKADRQDMYAAFRTYAVQSWLWDTRGRFGNMPMLPLSILHRLGIGNLVARDELDDTIELRKEPP